MPDAAVVDEAQDPLRAAELDLERLQALLTQACDTLMVRFAAAAGHLRAATPDPGAALVQLDAAVTALQFQDMAQQMLAHTQGLLARCAPAVSRAAARAHPVARAGIDAGSVELF